MKSRADRTLTGAAQRATHPDATLANPADIVAARNARARYRRVCLYRDPRNRFALYGWVPVDRGAP